MTSNSSTRSSPARISWRRIPTALRCSGLRAAISAILKRHLIWAWDSGSHIHQDRGDRCLKAGSIRRIRQAAQIASFVLFMVLFAWAVYLGRSPLPSDLFYRFDPLIAATAMLAGRVIKAGLLYSLITLAATVLFGRVWCGWICPFGSLLEWFSPRSVKGKVSERWRVVKFLLFFFLIFAAILGNQSGVFLDPISLLTRTMTTVLWPGLRFLVYGLESFLYQFDFLWPALDATQCQHTAAAFSGH